MHGTGAPLGRFSAEVPADARATARVVAETLARARTVLVLGHVGADGDVAGSSLALAQALRERGLDVTVYNARPYPDAYAWLPGGDAVVTTLADDARFDASVVVDAADPARCGPGLLPADRRGVFVWIDHHRIDPVPGDVSYVDLTAAAVGEMIVEVLDAMGQPLSTETAKCVYASLLSDTGGFRYGNTSARALRLAARLVELGVDPWEMTERIYESQDEARTRLLGHMLSSFWRSESTRFAVSVVTREDMTRAGAVDAHLQGLVNHLRAVRGVEVAVLVHDLDEGARVVMRSKGNVSCAPIAEKLGAAGHKNAASFTLPSDAHTAATAVQDALADLDGNAARAPRARPGARRTRRAAAR